MTMPGPWNVTERLRGAGPQDVAQWFFWAYVAFVLAQYPISSSLPGKLTFYGGFLPLLIVFGLKNRDALLRVVKAPLMLGFLALFGFVVLHALFLAPERAGLAKTFNNTVQTAAFVVGSAVFFACAGEDFIRRFLRLFALVAGACAAVSIGLFWYHYDPAVNITAYAESTPRLSPIGRTTHQILGALVYGIAGIAAVYLQSVTPGRRGKALYVAVTGVIGVMIALTQSRMPMLAYGLCVALAYALLLRISARQWAFALAGVLAVLVALAAIPAVHERMGDYVESVMARKDSFRMELWNITVEGIAERPLAGNGMAAKLDHPLASMPHNLYLATAFYLGLPAALAFMGLLLATGVAALRMLCARSESGVLAAVLFLHGLLSGLTDHGHLVKSPGPVWLIFWLPITFVIAESMKGRCEDKTEGA